MGAGCVAAGKPAGDRGDMMGLLSRLKLWWTGLPRTRQLTYGVLIGSILLAAVLFVQLASREKFSPLFTQLEPREASQVVEKLKELKVPYKLADEGTTILVPQSKVYDLRLTMAGSGVMASLGGVGFEIFDRTRLGVTEFERQVDYLRALQEELRRTITQMDEVRDARVHLVLPRETPFLEERRPASAAVTLKLEPLSKLEPEQIKAIAYLVSGSVENLKPEDVKIIDTQGHVLSDQVMFGDASGLTATQLAQAEAKRRFEKDMETRVTRSLERILGPDKAVVMITADLDFDQREVTRVDYGDIGTVRSEQVIEEEGSGEGGGVPPVGDPNREPVPGYVGGGAGGESTYRKSDTTRNYEIDKTEEKVIYAPGNVRSLSVAVAVDGPLPPEQTEQIRNIVAAATGYREGRDQIEVLSMAFDTSYAQQMEAEMAAREAEERRRELIRRYVILGSVVLGALAAAILVWVFLRRRQPAVPEEAVPELAAAEGYQPPPLPEEEVKRREQFRQARDLARQKPEEVAQLLRAWLMEE